MGCDNLKTICFNSRAKKDEFAYLLSDFNIVFVCKNDKHTLSDGIYCDVCEYSKAPSAPTVLSFTDTTVALVPTEGYEYSKDGEIWQESNEFTELSPSAEYTFYQRIAKTDTHIESESSLGLVVKTKALVEVEKPTNPTEPTTPNPTTPTLQTPTTSTNSETVVKTQTPAKVRKPTVKAGKKKVTVTWKAAKNAKKYIVKFSYKKNMKSAKTKTTKKLKLTLKKLKSGKKVYIQVRGINGNVKGKWSAKKSVKVK